MAKRVKARPAVLWAIVDKRTGEVRLAYRTRAYAREFASHWYRVERVLVTPLKAKS